MKKTFYEVQRAFYDDGSAITNIMRRVRADRKPKTRRAELYKCDVHISYYDTRAAAQQAVREERSA